jgi:hypothetical protein
MDQKTVNKLERELERAIAEVTMGMGLKRLPSQQTMHFMAKAAVAVYESAVENKHRSAAD